jgi:hypothetical protein
VHRRLLFAIRQLRLDPGAAFKKFIRVVGDVIGNFHPWCAEPAPFSCAVIASPLHRTMILMTGFTAPGFIFLFCIAENARGWPLASK